MLTRVLDWSLRNRLAVIVMWACIAVGGVVSALHLPLDALPDPTPVQVQINCPPCPRRTPNCKNRFSRPSSGSSSGQNRR